MKSNFMLSSVIIMATLFTTALFGHKELFIKEHLNTHGNSVNIRSGAVCHVIYSPQQTKHHECMVVCEGPGNDDKIFKNVGKVIGSATGTPGWLEYKNYIGSKLMDTGNEKDDAGGAKRVILCDGPCEKKDESAESSKHSGMKILPIID